jgi:hypothetical protein
MNQKRNWVSWWMNLWLVSVTKPVWSDPAGFFYRYLLFGIDVALQLSCKAYSILLYFMYLENKNIYLWENLSLKKEKTASFTLT